MRHDGLDIGVIIIGGGIGIGQNVFGIENVQALVLHSAHVEVVDGDDIEQVQIVFQAIFLLVPAHGTLQRFHGVATTVLIAGVGIYAQGDISS